MIDLTRAYVTALGQKVEGLHVENGVVIGTIPDLDRFPRGWNANGKVFDDMDSSLDLVEDVS